MAPANPMFQGVKQLAVFPFFKISFFCVWVVTTVVTRGLPAPPACSRELLLNTRCRNLRLKSTIAGLNSSFVYRAIIVP